MSKNAPTSLVVTAPVPSTSGVTLVVTAGEGSKFYLGQAFVHPDGVLPVAANMEIVTIGGIATDTLTIVRAQEGSNARSIVAGDRISQGITAGMWDRAQVKSPGIFYVDPVNGNDTYGGDGPNNAWASLDKADQTIGVDACEVRLAVAPVPHNASHPVTLRNNQKWRGWGGISVVGPYGIGGSGVVVKAAANFSGGRAVFLHEGSGGVGDSWHFGTMKEIGIDCNNVANLSAVFIYETGEESSLESVRVRNCAADAFYFAGYQASGVMKLCGVDDCIGHCVRMGSHPGGGIMTGNGGTFEITEFSGDNHSAGTFLFEGSHFVTIIKPKVEKYTVANSAFVEVSGSATGGARPKIVVIGGSCDPSSMGGQSNGDLFKVTGSATPVFIMLGMHTPWLTNLVNDTVAGRTIANPGTAPALLIWDQDGMSDSIIDLQQIHLPRVIKVTGNNIQPNAQLQLETSKAGYTAALVSDWAQNALLLQLGNQTILRTDGFTTPRKTIISGYTGTAVRVDTLTIDEYGIQLMNTTTTPPTPSGGPVLFGQGGAVKAIGTSGTVTTIANP
jgi:hypothetical protein